MQSDERETRPADGKFFPVDGKLQDKRKGMERRGMDRSRCSFRAMYEASMLQKRGYRYDRNRMIALITILSAREEAVGTFYRGSRALRKRVGKQTGPCRVQPSVRPRFRTMSAGDGLRDAVDAVNVRLQLNTCNV